MSRTSRSKQSWVSNVPAGLAALFVVALLGCSSFVIYAANRDELEHMRGPDHHTRLWENSADRSSLGLGRATDYSDEAALGSAASNGAAMDALPPGSAASNGAAMGGMRSRALAASEALSASHPAAEAAAKAFHERGRNVVGGQPDMKDPAVEPKKVQQPVAAAAVVVEATTTEVVAAKPTKAAGAVEAVTTKKPNKIVWQVQERKSCQNYADGDATPRSLEDAKVACLTKESCVAIECPHGDKNGGCTLRAIANMVDYAVSDCYEMLEMNAEGKIVSTKVHKDYNMLLKEYPFQQVTSQTGNQVNIILVRSQMQPHQIQLFEKYKNDILFLGISSMNDYPLNEKIDYVGMFPGFLHMMREPEKHFPPHVKTLLMSQSDFNLPDFPERDYSVPKKYDFTYSASDCDIASDGAGWCGWSKNWSFVRDALPMMCGEFKLKGVLVATKDKSGTKAYTIPESCKGRMIQTTYLAKQGDYFDYLKQSRFAFLPQIHDASPRVSSQALSADVPILMNYYIQGGWKYVNDKTGEFFHDKSDFREKLTAILKNADTPKRYEPRKWVLENYGNEHTGKRLYDFVMEHFSHRISLPKGTKRLLA